MASSIASLKRLSRVWNPDISVLIRGNHGIGKSAVVYQIAEDLGLPVMERRLSQMSEGDMIGLPWQETLGQAVTDTAIDTGRVVALAGLVGISQTSIDKDYKVTSFAPPDWLAKCAERPYVIFLDELNRATPEVMQAAFQLVLDRRVGSLRVHPECRIYAAINVAASYQVNEMDPALLDRFAVVDLEPTVEDWLEWARGPGKIHQLMIDFISQHNSHLEIGAKDKGTPGTINPSRRSWARLDVCLQRNDLYAEANVNDPIFFQVGASLIGTASSGAFQKFCITNNVLTAEDVLNRWKKVERRVKKMSDDNRTPELTSVLDRLKTFFEKNQLTDEQAKNYELFVKAIPAELAIASWKSIAQAGGLANCAKIMNGLSMYIVGVVQKSRQVGKV